MSTKWQSSNYSWEHDKPSVTNEFFSNGSESETFIAYMQMAFQHVILYVRHGIMSTSVSEGSTTL